MDTGSGRAIGLAPFHSRGALKGFVVSGRWPDSTKEWAQLLMVAVRVASLTRIALHHNDIRGPRRTAGCAGTRHRRTGPRRRHRRRRIRNSPRTFRGTSTPGAADAAPAFGDHAVAARMHRRRLGMRAAARASASGPGTPGRMGGSGIRRHDHLDGQPRRRRSDQPSRHRDPRDAPCRITVPRAGSGRRKTYGTRPAILVARSAVCWGDQRRGVAPNRRVDILAKARPANRASRPVGETFDRWSATRSGWPSTRRKVVACSRQP